MSHARRVVLAVVSAGSVIVTAFLIGAGDSATGGDGSVAPNGSGGSDARPSELASPASIERRDPRQEGAAQAQPEALLDDRALAELLARIQQAYSQENVRELEQLLSTLLANPEQGKALVAWLSRADASAPTDAVLGAVVALQAGIALYERDGARFGKAGEEMVLLALDALPILADELQAQVVRVLQRVRNANGHVLDGRFLSRLLELRSENAEQSERFTPLLAVLAEGSLAPEQRERFQQLFLDGEEDPLLVKCALSSLLAEDAGRYLHVAKELHGRDASNRELRSAIAQAIAVSAPVAEAARSLAEIADGSEYGAFATLATRPGVSEHVAREYDALLKDGANPRARKLLVSAMAGETDDVLVGIARIDPDPVVSLQAALTITVRGPIDAKRFEEVRTLFDEDIRSPSGSVMVAENVMLHSEGAVRDGARAWLVQLVRDASLSDQDRSEAYRRVRRWVEPGTFAGVQIGGRPLE